MREVTFVRQHQDRWQEFERILSDPSSVAPDSLAELFLECTDDLAFAHAQYPNSDTLRYLNQLAATIHTKLYKNKLERRDRWKQFLFYDVPLAMVDSRKELLLSLVVLVIPVVIGFWSGMTDERYTRSIMGDAYVNMTIANIAHGDPMGVYKQQDGLSMFFAIAMNNCMVCVQTIVIGVCTTLGPIVMIARNGFMLGAFHSLFLHHGGFERSLLTVYIHGAMEISAIVVAGAAGMLIGNGILFPGTFTRLQAFRNGVRKGVCVGIGILPFIIVAAVFESWVTRYTDMPLMLNILIILATFTSIVWYVIVFPQQVLARKKWNNSLHG
ncbi:stage II sporulation protein M [soil metagenome]